MTKNSVLNNYVITGATSEIAKATVRRLHEKGHNLLLFSRSVQDEFVITNNDSLVLQFSGIDLIKEQSQDKMLGTVRKHFNTKFGILHFAGDFWIHKPLIQTKYDEIVSMMGSHYLSLCNVTQALTQHMINCGGGKLLAFSCNSVAYNYPDMIPFTCAKAAVETFVKCFSNEYAQFGINALAIALPTIRTDRVVEEKPLGDHKNYISMSELSSIITEELLQLNDYVNSTIIKLFKHSESYYNEGYFDRNPRIKGIKKYAI